MPSVRRGQRGPLRVALEDWIKTYNLPPEVRAKFAGALSGVEHDLAGYMRAVLPGLGIPQREVDLLVGRLARLEGSENIGTFIGLFVMVIAGAIAASQSFSEPFVRFAGFVGNSAIPNKRLSEQEALRAYWRGVLTIEQRNNDLRAYGHADENHARLEAIYRPRLTEDELIQSLWRGQKTESQFRLELAHKGWSPDDVNAWREFANSIPGISDSIRFLVRDVFNEDIVRRYGYDEGWPVGPIIELGAKQGYSATLMQAWWRAHFQLPSPTQAAEMVHRAGLSLHDYDQLLRINDYPPFWRKYFMKLVYQPLTRVDIRRVYNVLGKDRDWLIARHKEIGYDDENASTLADFVIANRKEETKDLTKADIAAAYEDRALDRGAAVNQLKALGYDDNEADIILRRVDVRIRQERVQDEIELLHQKFLAGVVKEPEARSLLAGLGQSQVRIDTYLFKWDRENEVKPRLPTRSDAEAFARRGVITLDEYDDYLKLLGYGDIYRDWYRREITGEKPTTV